MPRISGTNAQDGAATTGRAYEPAVTPNIRDDDDPSVLGNRNAGHDKDVHGQFGRDSETAKMRGREGDVVDEGGLEPTYEVMDRDVDSHDRKHDPKARKDNNHRDKH